MELRQEKRVIRGFTLTEAAIVLGIMGLILAAVWVAAAAVYKNQRISTSSQQLLQIVQSMRTLHASQSSVEQVSNMSVWISAGVIPKDLVKSDGVSTVNAWGGAVTILSDGSSAFGIEFTNVPQTGCVDFIQRNSGSSRDSGLMYAGVGSQMNAGIHLEGNTNVLKVTDVLGQCTNVNNNNVIFTFDLRR